MPNYPDTFKEVVQKLGPLWTQMSPEEQVDIRERWWHGRLMQTGDPRNAENAQRLEAEAYADIRKTPTSQNKFWFGGSFWPPAEEWAPRMEKMVGRVGRLWATPQQIIEGFRAGKSLQQIEQETITDLVKDISGEEREERYPYHLYTDPLLVGGVAKKIALPLIRGGIKVGPSVIKALTPSARKAAEKVASRPMKWGKIPGEIPPLRTVGKPTSPIPTFGEIWKSGQYPLRKAGIQRGLQATYKKAMKMVAPHFPKEEAAQVAEFVARHPDDALSKAIIEGRSLTTPLEGGLTLADNISWRIFGRRPPITNLRPSVGVTTPPPITSPPPIGKGAESIVEEINTLNPNEYADFMKKMLELSKVK